MSSFVSVNGPSIDDRLATLVELDARALRARLEPLALQHDAGLHQLFVVLHHGGEQLLARHDACLGVLVGLADDHESHGAHPFGRCADD